MINKEQYITNKKSKVADFCICPVCNSDFVKKQYSQAFCCLKCKDRYHNSFGDRHKK